MTLIVDRESRHIVLPDAARNEIRAVDGGAPVLTGYGAVFNRYSQNLGGFVEQVDPGAFTDTLARGGDVLVCGNHNVDWLLGSTRSGTAVLAVDSIGLGYAVNLDPNDPDAQRMSAKVVAKKMRGSSFSFRTIEDSWGLTDQGFPLRTLLAVALHELGPVASPAYLDTANVDTAVALRSLAAHTGEKLDRVVQLAARNELRSLWGPNGAPSERSTDLDQEDPAQHASALAAARRRRELDLAARRF